MRGINNGLEKALQFLMPCLFVLMILLVAYAMTTGSYNKGLHFIFMPDFSKLTSDSVLTAMGHAFFTLSLGMGAIMVYGSYLPKGHIDCQNGFFDRGCRYGRGIIGGHRYFSYRVCQ